MKSFLRKLLGRSVSPPRHAGEPRPSFSLAETVPPRHPRSPEAAPGPFYVWSAQCIICALPPQTAPACIRFHQPSDPSESYCYVYRQPETHEELDHMIEAMTCSCVQAIRYCGTDPYILARLREEGAACLCDALPQTPRQAA